MLTLRSTRHPFRSDDGHIEACGDSRIAEGVAIKGAINSLAPDFELGLAPENKVSTLDDIFLIGLKIGIGWIGSGRIDGVGWAGHKVVA
ncbi:hypothetical protein OAV48_01820 [bacterium]|jgi:hypothetical protein|nr:hypothetical protein [Pseudomonadales bacterium]MDC3304829.1 hypothetical protein [bacterium]